VVLVQGVVQTLRNLQGKFLVSKKNGGFFRMKKVFCVLVFLLFVFSACGPEISGEMQTREKTVKRPVEKILKAEVFKEPIVANEVRQTRNEEEIIWGFDNLNNLVSLKFDDKETLFYHKDNVLRKITDNEKTVELQYADGFLSSVSGSTGLPKHYVVESGLLRSADDYKFTYSEDGSLMTFQEGKGVGLNFFYEDDVLKFYKKGNIVTHFFYNRKGQLTQIEEDNSRHLILGYGRERVLVSLSGGFYGLGETFDYGSGRIMIVSNNEKNTFYGNDALNKKVFELYLSCKRLRKGFRVFEPLAFVVKQDYMKHGVYDYMIENFYCEWLP
jgi:hypothetical protein